MEEKNLKIINTYEELKEPAEIYNKCLFASEEKMKLIKIPSLKYFIYLLQLFQAFTNRINQIKSNIKEIKEKLKDFEGNNKIDALEKLDKIMKQLVSFEKEAKERYEYYRIYLINIARESDNLGNETAKNVYIKTCEGIIKTQIEFNMKCEKQFLIIKDDINKIKNIFNI